MSEIQRPLPPRNNFGTSGSIEGPTASNLPDHLLANPKIRQQLDNTAPPPREYIAASDSRDVVRDHSRTIADTQFRRQLAPAKNKDLHNDQRVASVLFEDTRRNQMRQLKEDIAEKRRSKEKRLG